MKRHTLPELLRHAPTGSAWQQRNPPHTPHEPTANPRRRTIHHTTHDDKQAHAQRIAALVASRYNSRRPNQIAPIWSTDDPEARQLFHAAQELRNRHLAHLARPELPRPRYYLPEQLAAHHATRTTYDHAYTLELAALLHHPKDLATYLDTLTKRHDAQELAETTARTHHKITAHLENLLDDLRNKKHGPRLKGLHIQLTAAEYAAKNIQLELEKTQRNADRAGKERTKRKREQRRTQRNQERERKGNNQPSAGDLAGWYPVNFDKPPREVPHTGRLGRRRIATNAGKNPNRIHNYAGDPMRRIFTRKTRGTNALVIVDCSGSMQLTPDDLAAIMTASAGATVIGYSADNYTHPNTYLLAHKGSRVRQMPDFAGNNGNDAPAADYAVKNYRKTGAPVLWITDGRATGNGHDTAEPLRHQCRKIAQRHAITISRTVPEALADLALIRAGNRPPQRLHTFQ